MAVRCHSCSWTPLLHHGAGPGPVVPAGLSYPGQPPRPGVSTGLLLPATYQPCAAMILLPSSACCCPHQRDAPSRPASQTPVVSAGLGSSRWCMEQHPESSGQGAAVRGAETCSVWHLRCLGMAGCSLSSCWVPGHAWKPAPPADDRHTGTPGHSAETAALPHENQARQCRATGGAARRAKHPSLLASVRLRALPAAEQVGAAGARYRMQALRGATGCCVVPCAPAGQWARQQRVISMGRRAGWAQGLSAGVGAQPGQGSEGAVPAPLREGEPCMGVCQRHQGGDGVHPSPCLSSPCPRAAPVPSCCAPHTLQTRGTESQQGRAIFNGFFCLI